MAVYTYTTTNISFSTFDIWSNAGYTDDTDINLGAIGLEMEPALSLSDVAVSDLYNRSIFYGNVISTGNGTVQITYPYTSATSTGTLQIKNVDYSVYSYIRLAAVGTYPFNFSEWRTASGGGGTQISTSANLDLTVSDYTSQVNFYAYFV
jgi:hypothetical protein